MTSTLIRDGNTITIGTLADLTWVPPAATSVNAGTTTAAIVWPTPTGGRTPYTYGNVAVVFDSRAELTTATFTTSGSPGTTSFSSLVDGQTVVVSRSVTDANGDILTIQAAVAVGSVAATITPGTAPAGQTLAAGTTTVTIGTWGAPSGGTGPYTYAVTDISGGGTTITGSGLGEWSASGLSDGQTYAFLLTITDSLGAVGYSVVTVSVAKVANLGLWVIEDELDFTDADWTSFSSTSTTASTTAWQHTLYAADGVTARCYVYNNNAESRTLSLTPGGSGLTLVNGTAAVQPTMAIWPAGWTSLLGGSRKDAWMIEAVMEGEEPTGSTSVVHMLGISTGGSVLNASPSTGWRVTATSTNLSIRAYSYISGFAEQAVQTVTAGASRLWKGSMQVTVADSRRHDIYLSVGSTDFKDPETGIRVRVQSSSTTMTAPNAESAATFAWFATTIQNRLKFWFYHDGVATTGSYIRLRKIRLLRLPQGSR
jgi:hypothetical protein